MRLPSRLLWDRPNASSSVDPHLYDDELITQDSQFNRLRLTFLRPGCFAHLRQESCTCSNNDHFIFSTWAVHRRYSGIRRKLNGRSYCNARATVFASSVNARTFDYPGGDIVYVPPTTFGHYVENTSNATLKYLEIFNSNIYEDFSLNQWLALAPPDMAKAHLQLSNETISQRKKTPRKTIYKLIDV